MHAAPEPTLPIEVTLVAAARRGDRAAFGALYQRHARMVQAVILSRVPPDAVADLVQDVFLSAMGRLTSLRDDAAFAPWIATIARRRAADWRRRKRDLVPLEEASLEAMAKDETPSDALETRAALEAIRSLPEAYRETLLLRFVAGLSGPEIAARTGLTHGSVRVNLHRGVAMLRARLGEVRGGDDA